MTITKWILLTLFAGVFGTLLFYGHLERKQKDKEYEKKKRQVQSETARSDSVQSDYEVPAEIMSAMSKPVVKIRADLSHGGTTLACKILSLDEIDVTQTRLREGLRRTFDTPTIMVWKKWVIVRDPAKIHWALLAHDGNKGPVMSAHDAVTWLKTCLSEDEFHHRQIVTTNHLQWDHADKQIIGGFWR